MSRKPSQSKAVARKAAEGDKRWWENRAKNEKDPDTKAIYDRAARRADERAKKNR